MNDLKKIAYFTQPLFLALKKNATKSVQNTQVNTVYQLRNIRIISIKKILYYFVCSIGVFS